MLCKITKLVDGKRDRERLLSLPKTQQELNAYLQDMGIGKENGFEYIITDIKTQNPVFDDFLKNCESIDELNHIAEFMHGCNQEQLDELAEIIAVEHPYTAMDFINIMHNAKDYMVYEDINTIEDLGKEVAFRQNGIDDESPLGMCIDYKAYGESFQDAHGGLFDNGKYFIPPSNPPYYDGMDFPWNGDKNSNLLLAVYVTTYEKIREYGDETPPGIWLELPTTKYDIDRIVHRLGAEDVGDCYVYTQESKLLSFENERIFEPVDSLYEINTLAEILSLCRDSEMLEKFDAVLEYEGGMLIELADVINTACNLDCYDFKPEIETPEDYVIYTYGDDPVKLALADNLDGEALLAKCGGKITEYGFVARNDTPMTEVYTPEEPAQGQDFTQQM